MRSRRGAEARWSCADRRSTFAASRSRFGPAVRTQKQWRTAFDANIPWFRALSDPNDREARVDRFLSVTDVDGVPTQVVELTGQPGDVVLCHPWLVHNGGPNANARPRMMRASRVHHVEVLAVYARKLAVDA